MTSGPHESYYHMIASLHALCIAQPDGTMPAVLPTADALRSCLGMFLAAPGVFAEAVPRTTPDGGLLVQFAADEQPDVFFAAQVDHGAGHIVLHVPLCAYLWTGNPAECDGSDIVVRVINAE